MLGETAVQPSVALIGSFRQHYVIVCEALEAFRAAGWRILHPAGSKVLEPGLDFVRFETDEPKLSDAEIQAVTLRNILKADLTFVVAPDGYVGRTTCYEIGRLMQAKRAVVYSEHPHDLPVEVPSTHVLAASEAALRFHSSLPAWAYSGAPGNLADIERSLVA
jgi:hypothetical protein